MNSVASRLVSLRAGCEYIAFLVSNNASLTIRSWITLRQSGIGYARPKSKVHTKEPSFALSGQGFRDCGVYPSGAIIGSYNRAERALALRRFYTDGSSVCAAERCSRRDKLECRKVKPFWRWPRFAFAVFPWGKTVASAKTANITSLSLRHSR